MPEDQKPISREEIARMIETAFGFAVGSGIEKYGYFSLEKVQ